MSKVWPSISDAKYPVTFIRCGPSGGTMRVLFVTNMWPDEEQQFYGTFIKSQAESLVEAGLSVDVAYVRGHRSMANYATGLRRVGRLARESRYDVLHAHYGHTAAMLATVGRRPRVVSYCGEDLLGAPRGNSITVKSRLEVAVFRHLSRVYDVSITKSRGMERALPANLRARNHIVPNGVNLGMFSPIPRAQARTRLGWPSDGAIALFLGNPADPRKNVQLAERAISALASEGMNIQLKIAWRIPRLDVPSLMSAADCLVFPSRSEGSPNAVKEAMACELPIVATAVGDLEERLAGIAGCYLSQPQPGVFSQHIAAAVKHGRTSEAREAVASISTQAVAQRLIGIYETALHTSPATAKDSNRA